MAWFRKKIDDDYKQVLKKLDGRQVKYVTRRILNEQGSPEELILGKEGRVTALETDISVLVGVEEVYRAPIVDTQCSELLSGDGVVVKGQNRITGQQDTLVAYYKYYR
ncbi:MAG: hypothetical protein IJZ13_03135 [Clostridia bacterium]|nr:hypothetical protein [Clostridia bacterium]